MHCIEIPADIRDYLPGDLWTIDRRCLERLAERILGCSGNPWLREPGKPGRIMRRRHGKAHSIERGSLSAHFDHEFQALSEVSEIAERDVACSARKMMIIASYHLRFAAIHPLRDGNGRIGRMIMAYQCESIYGVPIEEITADLYVARKEYNNVFGPRNFNLRFVLLTDLLLRIAGIMAADLWENGPPFPLDPIFPDSRPVSNEEFALLASQPLGRE